jgi:hypothetical protein
MMRIGPLAPLSLAWFSLRMTTRRERGAILVALLLLAFVAAAMVSRGQFVGANVWRPGWICGEGVKGSPFCTPDPRFRG